MEQHSHVWRPDPLAASLSEILILWDMFHQIFALSFGLGSWVWYQYIDIIVSSPFCLAPLGPSCQQMANGVLRGATGGKWLPAAGKRCETVPLVSRRVDLCTVKFE